MEPSHTVPGASGAARIAAQKVGGHTALGETLTKGLPSLQETLDLVEEVFHHLFAVEE